MAVLFNIVTHLVAVLDSPEMWLDAVPWVFDVASSATKCVRAMCGSSIDSGQEEVKGLIHGQQ
jgi:hypothetical protein